jgi:hypothetical protein
LLSYALVAGGLGDGASISRVLFVGGGLLNMIFNKCLRETSVNVIRLV